MRNQARAALPTVKSLKLTLVMAGAIAALSSCDDGEKSHRGIELMPDMFHTPAYHSMQAMEIHQDQSADHKEHQFSSLIPPVPGTVPRDFVPYQIAPADWDSARKLVNPLLPTAEVLKEGQHGFNIYCATCHGRDGSSTNGYVAKHFSGIPSLNGANVAAFSDGEIYHIMTVGRGRMPSYAAQLMPQSRWAVVQYLRALDRAAIAMSDVSKMVQDAELAVRDNPEDATKKAVLEVDRNLLETRTRDLAAIQKVGDEAGEQFVPLPDPLPEYVVPTWPESEAHPAHQEPGK